MTEQARFDFREQDGVAVIDIAGEIDMLNAGELRAALAAATDEDEGPLVVALSRTQYFDSQTLEILVDFSKRLSLTRRRMFLVAALASQARRLLDVSAISTVIPTHESVDEAVAAARADG